MMTARISSKAADINYSSARIGQSPAEQEIVHCNYIGKQPESIRKISIFTFIHSAYAATWFLSPKSLNHKGHHTCPGGRCQGEHNTCTCTCSAAASAGEGHEVFIFLPKISVFFPVGASGRCVFSFVLLCVLRGERFFLFNP